MAKLRSRRSSAATVSTSIRRGRMSESSAGLLVAPTATYPRSEGAARPPEELRCGKRPPPTGSAQDHSGSYTPSGGSLLPPHLNDRQAEVPDRHQSAHTRRNTLDCTGCARCPSPPFRGRCCSPLQCAAPHCLGSCATRASTALSFLWRPSISLGAGAAHQRGPF